MSDDADRPNPAEPEQGNPTIEGSGSHGGPTERDVLALSQIVEACK